MFAAETEMAARIRAARRVSIAVCGAQTEMETEIKPRWKPRSKFGFARGCRGPPNPNAVCRDTVSVAARGRQRAISAENRDGSEQNRDGRGE